MNRGGRGAGRSSTARSLPPARFWNSVDGHSRANGKPQDARLRGGDTQGRASFPRTRESTLASALNSQFEVDLLLERGNRSVASSALAKQDDEPD